VVFTQLKNINFYTIFFDLVLFCLAFLLAYLIRFAGLRQGEKLCEELITEGEGIVPTAHEKIMVLKSNGNWNGHVSRERFQAFLQTHVNDLTQRRSCMMSVASGRK
jgi:FlaA1/EpsC-like NDP-sugar epimerase